MMEPLIHEEGGAKVITERLEYVTSGIIKWQTRIEHPEFWPIYTANDGVRCKVGYKSEQEARKGHERMVRAFQGWCRRNRIYPEPTYGNEGW
jgi:hypothetical protein